MKTFVIAASTLGLAISAVPALAGPAQGETRTISTVGLDLGTAEGQKMLDNRINRAARKVCRVDEARTNTRLRSSEAKKCYDKARASAKRQMASIAAKPRVGG